ncbi:MAG: hypothetical protein JXB49_18435 [Bacteroidales bacterium]|nr:hypothetical protein [Bacteroidales bacterium]
MVSAFIVFSIAFNLYGITNQFPYIVNKPSLEIVDLVIDIEWKFKISISHEEQKKIETIGNVLILIGKYQRI